MPKKLNFLGGMQNYNPNNGEYEPALKGPNGESAKSFAKFGKGNSEKKESPKNKYEETVEKLNKEQGLDSKKGFKVVKTDDIAYDGTNILHPSGVGMTPNELKYALEKGTLKGYGDVAKQKEEAMEKGKFVTENDDVDWVLVDDYLDQIDDLEKDLMSSGLDKEEFAEELSKIQKDIQDNKLKLGEKGFNIIQEKLDKHLKGMSNKAEEKPSEKYFKHPQVDGLWKDTGKTFEKNGNTYKVFENEEGTKWGVSEKFASQFEEAKAPKVEKKPEDYEGVKTTPYGFIYNVNGKSITDLKEQSKKLGLGNASGYSLTVGGDESYYKTFEEAYKAAKGK